MKEYTPDPGWLTETIKRAKERVEKLPEWQRDYLRAQVAAITESGDPCVSKRRCDEAQTCVGGCVYR